VHRLLERPVMRIPITLVTIPILVSCLVSVVDAAPCPARPRDWSAKTLEAFGEGGAIWKLDDPGITVDTLATALSTAYMRLYHDPTKVPEPPFLERFHAPATWKPLGGDLDVETLDYRARDAYLQDEEVLRTAIGRKLPAGWSWGPNPAHSSFDLFKFDHAAARKSAKCRNEGLVLIGYYKWVDNLAGDARTPEAINEKRKNPQYIVSIMDLTTEHVAWLKALRTRGLAWLKATYDVDPGADGDTVRMYFHWPTGHPTSTLHMHVRVNWTMSPVEYIHSYTLDDIIAALEANKTVAQMIAERYKRLGGVVIDGRFDAMTAQGESPANLLDRYLRSVESNKVRVFRDPNQLPVEAFQSVKNVLRTVQMIEEGGKKYYVQRTDPREKATNKVRVDKLRPADVWTPGPDQTLFTEAEISALRLDGYRGSMTHLFGCLIPFFDNATVEDCVRINRDGSDLERAPTVASLRAALPCPPASTCYAARVDVSFKVNGTFRLWVSDEDWDKLKGLDARKLGMYGYIDGNVIDDNRATTKFDVIAIGGKNIVNGIPSRVRDAMKLPAEYEKDEKIIARWISRPAMIVMPN
jgi:hypothetical protein